MSRSIAVAESSEPKYHEALTDLPYLLAIRPIDFKYVSPESFKWPAFITRSPDSWQRLPTTVRRNAAFNLS